MGLGLGFGVQKSSYIGGIVLPTSLGDMVHFFQHQTGVTTDGSIISGWEDQIGTANLSQSSSARQAPYDSSTGAIDFANSETSSQSNRLEFASVQAFTGAFSLFFVAKLEAFPGPQVRAFHGFSSGGTLTASDSTLNFYDNTGDLSSTTWQMVFAGSAAGSTSSSVSQATNPDPIHDVKTLVVVTVSDTDGGTAKVYFGGNDPDNLSSINLTGSATLSGDKNFDIKIIGHQVGSPTRQLGGDLFEWGTYSKELSSSEVDQLFDIMKNRNLIG